MERGQEDMTVNSFSSFLSGHKAVWAFHWELCRELPLHRTAVAPYKASIGVGGCHYPA